MNEFGLKQDYDFKEVKVFLPKYRSRRQIHDKIFFIVTPVIQKLEKMQLINGFHFIIHEHIDLRISCTRWTKRNTEYFESLLSECGIQDHLVRWPGLSPKIYGGEVGVNLCYNSLEYNSRLVMMDVDASYMNTRELLKWKRERDEVNRAGLFFNQFQHFLLYQYGVDGDAEIINLFWNFKTRLRMLSKEASRLAAVKLLIKCLKLLLPKRWR